MQFCYCSALFPGSLSGVLGVNALRENILWDQLGVVPCHWNCQTSA